MRRLVMFSAIFGLLAGCTAKTPVAMRAFSGLIAADGVTFVSSPGGGVVSLLYDAFEVKADPKLAPARKKPLIVSRRFTLGVLAPGKPVPGKADDVAHMQIRGAVHAPAGSFAMRVETPSGPVDLTPQQHDGNFIQCLAFAADKKAIAMRVVVTLNAPKPTEDGSLPIDDGLMVIDTIDVSRSGGDLAAKPGSCPVPANAAG